MARTNRPVRDRRAGAGAAGIEGDTRLDLPPPCGVRNRAPPSMGTGQPAGIRCVSRSGRPCSISRTSAALSASPPSREVSIISCAAGYAHLSPMGTPGSAVASPAAGRRTIRSRRSCIGGTTGHLGLKAIAPVRCTTIASMSLPCFWLCAKAGGPGRARPIGRLPYRRRSGAGSTSGRAGAARRRRSGCRARPCRGRITCSTSSAATRWAACASILTGPI